jgi:uncharacterized protein (TIGR02145 family)
MINFSKFIGFILAITILSSCEDKSTPTAPVISTNNVTQISTVSAVSGGIITNDGGAAIISKGICWNTSDNPTVNNNKTTESGESLSFTSNLTQLQPNTSYYVRAYAVNSAGTSYGNSVSFKTGGDKPSPVSQNATNIQQTTATLNGTVNPNSITTTVTFEYGVTTSYGSTATAQQSPLSGDAEMIVSVNLTGLKSGTTYHFRIKAENSLGIIYSPDITFTTSGSVPTIVTSEVSQITHIHAFCGGTIISDGGIATTSRGVCWSTSPNPTISDNKTSDLFGLSPGYFPSFISGLNANTIYYLRAYGTNSSGTGYGQQVQFVTLTNYTGQTGTISDNDGNSYQTIGIGSQVWMAENLKTTKFNDGVAIQNVTSDAAWAALTTPAYCIFNNDALNYKPTYGVLYNWHTIDAAANGNRNVCPAGWHVPSDEEWTTLKNYLGESVSGVWSFTTLSTGSNIAGKMLKEAGTLHWLAPNTGTNDTGFKALPGGSRNPTGFFNYIGTNGYWWSSTKQNWGNMDAYFNSIYNDNSVMSVDPGNRSYGFSVRCIKN